MRSDGVDEHRRIEMHLRSAGEQRVSISAIDLTISFEDGETIWTESSHKFDAAELRSMASDAGFAQETCWVDREWPFAECLWNVRG